MEWKIENSSVDYRLALQTMEDRVLQIANGKKSELVWLLEHESLYTAGSSADQSELANNNKLPVFYVGRGGKYTYHGPGQRIAYIMLDLKKRDLCDLKLYIYKLQDIIIKVLGKIGIIAFKKDGYIGVWVKKNGIQKKIAAIGIRVKKWITYHGVAVNISPDLLQYFGIVPCGIKQFGVTSVHDLGFNIDYKEFDTYFKETFYEVFNKVI